ncbi:MAG TPA: NAD(P)-binding domain-containing protein [Polyangiaceae bacterium LLY-WYZ-14_1]|nr:NAD(P)-binding domain-containing protein [Polyangiaceae bacterium LLY-WYZ-14_1]
MFSLPRVCVIGAGSSGIAVAKALYDQGIPFDVYEKGDRVGGNWVFKNKNGQSSAYRSLHINTSTVRMQYADYPMPDHFPDFPHHSLMARYFQDYVDHFGFGHRIQFETPVEHVAPRPGGGYEVRLGDGRTESYDAIAVANGHHWDPRWPEPAFPGRFDGVEMHSHHYIDPQDPHDLVGKRVVVLGMGNSAMDIACELGRPGVAGRTYLAARRGAWVIPNYVFGRPLDQIAALPPAVPFRVRQQLLKLVYRLAVGRPEDFGLPAPDHEILTAHPTISSDLLPKLGRGDVVPKPNIAELLGDRVRFDDGTVEEVDAIVYCTGYKVSFPFFDPGFVSAPDNDLPLFKRVFRPGIPDLFFIGLVQPLGAVMPIAEAQGKWVAEFLRGWYALPSEEKMIEDIEGERSAMFRRYVKSKRHTMQIDFDDYLADLAREVRAGRKRARALENVLPIPPRATARQARPAEGTVAG